jgi:hypothetical protein
MDERRVYNFQKILIGPSYEASKRRRRTSNEANVGRPIRRPERSEPGGGGGGSGDFPQRKDGSYEGPSSALVSFRSGLRMPLVYLRMNITGHRAFLGGPAPQTPRGSLRSDLHMPGRPPYEHNWTSRLPGGHLQHNRLVITPANMSIPSQVLIFRLFS